MAHRLSRRLLVPATLLLLLAGGRGNAQQPEEVLPIPKPGGFAAKPAEPAPAAKELSAQEVDVLIEKAFGKDCAELKRPIRLFIPDLGIAISAEAQAYEPCCDEEEPGRLSPYHRAALYALRELTGRDTAPTAAAWRKLLKLQAR